MGMCEGMSTRTGDCEVVLAGQGAGGRWLAQHNGEPLLSLSQGWLASGHVFHIGTRYTSFSCSSSPGPGALPGHVCHIETRYMMWSPMLHILS